jgi:hypothetical protein
MVSYHGFSTGGGDFANGGVAGLVAAGFPTVKYLRIFWRRFGTQAAHGEQIVPRS